MKLMRSDYYDRYPLSRLIRVTGSDYIGLRILCPKCEAEVGGGNGCRHCGSPIVCFNLLSQYEKLIANSYLEDCDTAASYFHQLAPFYAKNDWSHLEMSVLEMYAQCLNRQTDRNEEYIKSAFQIIEKVVQRRRTTPLYQPSRYASGHLDKLLFASKSLDQPISVSMDRFFGDIRLDPFLRHHDVHDGFQLILRFRYLMPEGMLASKVRAKIVSVDTEQSNEIWLTADDFGRMELGLVTVLLRSNVRRLKIPFKFGFSLFRLCYRPGIL